MGMLKDGLVCPNCQHIVSFVLDTRKTEGGLRRTRRCMKCQTRFYSLESIIERILPDSQGRYLRGPDMPNRRKPEDATAYSQRKRYNNSLQSPTQGVPAGEDSGAGQLDQQERADQSDCSQKRRRQDNPCSRGAKD